MDTGGKETMDTEGKGNMDTGGKKNNGKETRYFGKKILSNSIK